MKKLFLLIIPIAHLLLLSRLNFTAWPEMFSYPYLLSHGFVLYKDFIMPYPPMLVILLSAIFTIFGFSVSVLQAITWFYILLIDLLLFWILQKISKNIYFNIFILLIFIPLQSFLDGNMLWFDIVTVVPLLATFLMVLKWKEEFKLKYLLFSGFFLGLTVLIKQIALVYAIPLIISYLLFRKTIIFKDIACLVIGPAVLLIGLVFYLYQTSSLLEFWQWTITYPLFEWSKFPGYINFLISKKYLFITMLILLPLVGILIDWKNLLKNESTYDLRVGVSSRRNDKLLLSSLAFLIAALVAVYPRFSFFHLQPALAFLIICYFSILIGLPQKLKILHGGLLIMVTIMIITLLFQNSVGTNIRFAGSSDQKLSEAINKQTNRHEKIFLLGLNSSVYTFADRLPSKNWSDNFGWYLEIPGVQNWVLEGFKSDPPQVIFWRETSRGEWFNLGTYQPQQVTSFIRRNYIETGKIEPGITIWTRKN